MTQTAAGRYTADFRIQKYGSYLLKAVHQRDGKTVAESLGSVALSYPLETCAPPPIPSRCTPAQVWDPAGEKVHYTQDLWPFVLLGVLALFLLDLYAKRVRLFGYRTIKFQ